MEMFILAPLFIVVVCIIAFAIKAASNKGGASKYGGSYGSSNYGSSRRSSAGNEAGILLLVFGLIALAASPALLAGKGSGKGSGVIFFIIIAIIGGVAYFMLKK